MFPRGRMYSGFQGSPAVPLRIIPNKPTVTGVTYGKRPLFIPTSPIGTSLEDVVLALAGTMASPTLTNQLQDISRISGRIVQTQPCIQFLYSHRKSE